MLKNQDLKKNIIFILFFVACIVELFSVGFGDRNMLIFSRISLIIFLLLFYIYSTKEINRILIFTLLSFLLSDILFSVLSINLYGMLGLTIARIALIKLVLSDTRQIDWKIFGVAATFFLLIAIIILSLFYKDNLFYYSSLVTTFFLIIFSSLSFMNLVKENRKSDTYMFLGAALFVVSDAVFGANKFEHVDYVYTLLSSLFYDIAFFLICLSVLKRVKRGVFLEEGLGI